LQGDDRVRRIRRNSQRARFSFFPIQQKNKYSNVYYHHATLRAYIIILFTYNTQIHVRTRTRSRYINWFIQMQPNKWDAPYSLSIDDDRARGIQIFRGIPENAAVPNGRDDPDSRRSTPYTTYLHSIIIIITIIIVLQRIAIRVSRIVNIYIINNRPWSTDPYT